jgi:hypothetical protein
MGAPHVADLAVQDQLRMDSGQMTRIVAAMTRVQQMIDTDPANYTTRFNVASGRRESTFVGTHLRLLPIPMQYRVVHSPALPQPGGLQEMLRHKEDTIGAVFGVPRALMISEGVTRENVETYGENMGLQTQRMQRIVGKMLADVLTLALEPALRHHAASMDTNEWDAYERKRRPKDSGAESETSSRGVSEKGAEPPTPWRYSKDMEERHLRSIQLRRPLFRVRFEAVALKERVERDPMLELQPEVHEILHPELAAPAAGAKKKPAAKKRRK